MWFKRSGAASGEGGGGSSSSSSEPEPPYGIKKVNDAVFKLCEPSGPLEVEIVFLHGLQIYGFREAYWKTWIAGTKGADGKEFCWPIAWLSEDFPGARIWSISYDSSAIKTSTTGNSDGYSIAESVVQNMVDLANIGQANCPVVFVCHSLGGIVVKEIVIRAHTDFGKDPKYVTFLRNIRGFHFYATPHLGSELADLAALLPIKKGKMVGELKVINDNLGRRIAAFERIESENYSGKWEFAVVAETHVTKAYGFGKKVVKETSARYRGKCLPVDADHFGVCKPESRSSTSYLSLSSFITKVTGVQLLTQSAVAEAEELT